MFAIAQNNGTIDWVVQASVRAVRGRIAAVPWVMFGVAAVLTAVGAVSPAVVAIIAPVALGFAAQYRLSPLLMGLTVIAAVLFVVLGGRELMTRRDSVTAGGAGEPAGVGAAGTVAGSASGGTSAAAPTVSRDVPAQASGAGGLDGSRASKDVVLTLLGMAGIAVASLAFKLDVGLVALTVAVALALLSPRSQKGAVDKIAWSTVLLIGGVVTYVGVLQEIGTVTYVGDGIAGLGAPLLAALLLCYLGGIVSAFASSTAILGVTIPLAVPFLLGGEIGAVGMIAALAVSSTIVDVSPFSTNGALVAANAQDVDKDVFFRQLMAYGGIVVVTPILIWVVFVVPGWL